MFKLVVFLVVITVAAARPGYLHTPLAYNSAVVSSVPTSVSQQSSSVVHHAALAAPIAHTAYAAPIVAAYGTHAYGLHDVHHGLVF